jgi:hypothetical protein|tara:strand:+ start:135 stop:683 length:549 start_codon:yes stop_codon:yes gene_type:complete
MAFWSTNDLEPLRKFRFQIQIGNDSSIWWAKSVTQPSPDVSMSEYQLINHKIKYPGIVTWNDIDIAMVDVGGIGHQFYDELTDSGYNPSGATDGIIKEQYKGQVFKINKINADGVVVETWELINPFIKSIKYSDLDYSSDDFVEVAITVAYDSALLTGGVKQNEDRLTRLRERDTGADIIDL